MKTLGYVRRHLLNELLSQPRLMEQVQSLPSQDFHQIILQVGLEDCGELVSLATAAQLEEMFDADLWQNVAPGEQEQFDSQRFVLWLEMLLEAGEDVAVEKILDMDKELVTIAMAKELLVLATDDLNAIFQHENDDTRQADILLESCLYEELSDFQIISRNPETWDTLLTLLVALDKAHHDFLRDLLERLAGIGDLQVAENSLYTVLSEMESLFENVADKRDVRRGEKGYVSSLDARAFLGLADVHAIDDLLRPGTRDAITAAYFRNYSPAVAQKPEAETQSLASELMSLVKQHMPSMSASPATALLEGNIADNQTIFQYALQQLQTDDPSLYRMRISELSFLGNVVAAGCSLQGQPFRNVDASRAAMATSVLGIHVALERRRMGCNELNMLEIIREISMERLFLAGWKSLPRTTPSSRAFPFNYHDTQADVYHFYSNRDCLPGEFRHERK